MCLGEKIIFESEVYDLNKDLIHEVVKFDDSYFVNTDEYIKSCTGVEKGVWILKSHTNSDFMKAGLPSGDLWYSYKKFRRSKK
jgi:hypothetical protein